MRQKQQPRFERQQMNHSIRKLICITAALMMLIGLVPARPGSKAEADCATILRSMSTEDKICQMLVVTFGYYSDGSGGQILPNSAVQALRNHCFGGVILFAQNTAENADTVRYIDAVQRANLEGGAARPQLLFCVDQEGGMITRLGHGTQTPGNMALGAIESSNAAYTAGSIIGSELAALGINVDFAPDVDINSNPANPVIGVRSFSDSASSVSERGVKYMNGLMSSGTVATLKHFPGHGDTSTDSHTGLPLIERSYDQLRQRELIPFQNCINAGAEMVMTAHIQFPQIDSTTYTSKSTGEQVYLPATLSKKIITDVLRGDMGFNGVVITDGMIMDALAQHFDIYDTAKLAIEAGVDLLLMPVNSSGSSGINRLETYISRLVSMAENGEISVEKIDAAVTRILRLKQRHGLTSPYNGSDLQSRIANAERTVGSAAHHAEEWTLAKRAITLVKNDGSLLPLTHSGEKTVFFTADSGANLSIQYAVDLLRSEGKLPSGSSVEIYTYKDRNLDYLQGKIRGANNVIVVSEVRSASALRGSTARMIDSLIDAVHSSGGKFVLLSANLPYDAARYQKADAILLAYSSKGMNEDPRVTEGAALQYGPNLPAAVYCMFSPSDPPGGRLPVRVPKLSSDYHFTNQTLYERGFSLSNGQQPDNTPQPTPEPGATESPEADTSETPEPNPGTTGEPDSDETPSFEPSNTDFITADPVFSPGPEDSGTPLSASPTHSGKGTADDVPGIAPWTLMLLAGGLILIVISALLLVRRKR